MDLFQNISILITSLMSSMSLPMTIAIIASIASYLLIPILLGSKNRKNWKGAPPGPVGWPVLGSLPDLSNKIHEDFFKLSKVHGPLFSLKLGMKAAIVVQSPEMAKEVLKTKEGFISSRTITEAIKVATYGAMAIVFSPYGPRWKALRKILIMELLSSKAFEQFEPLRRREVHGLLRHLHAMSASRTQINMAEYAFSAIANLVSDILVSKSLFDNTKKEGKMFKEAFWELLQIVGTPNLADLIPILRPFDLQGLKRKAQKVFKQLDNCYEKIMKERLEERSTGNRQSVAGNMKKDLLDVLLDYRSHDHQNNLDKLHSSVVKGMLLEIFIAGTETISSTVEWGMSEILRKPDIHKKLVAELDRVIGNKRFVEEHDIQNLPYLQATVKEIFRLHPAAPLIVPRRTNEACQVAGYQLPKHCIVYVNVWGMGRDSSIWDNPYEFNPDRFIGSSVDVKGQDFNLLPFGSGRRSCVGWPLAHRMVHFYVASFLHAFEWECPSEVLDDMGERVGLTIQKVISLLAVPKSRLPDFVYQN